MIMKKGTRRRKYNKELYEEMEMVQISNFSRRQRIQELKHICGKEMRTN